MQQQQQLMQQHVGQAEREVSPTCGQFPRPAFGPHGATVSPLPRSFSLFLSLSERRSIASFVSCYSSPCFPRVCFLLVLLQENLSVPKNKTKKKHAISPALSVSQSVSRGYLRTCATARAVRRQQVTEEENDDDDEEEDKKVWGR